MKTQTEEILHSQLIETLRVLREIVAENKELKRSNNAMLFKLVKFAKRIEKLEEKLIAQHQHRIMEN